MRKTTFIIALLMLSVMAFSQETDKKEIKEVIQSAYVDGIQNLGDIEDIENGFHPGFDLLIFRDNMVNDLPIYNWIEYVKLRKAKNPEGVTEEEMVSCEYDMIDITGTAAVAKIKLFKGGKHIYTDYLSLYKFKEGWKIVSKIYYAIPDKEIE